MIRNCFQGNWAAPQEPTVIITVLAKKGEKYAFVWDEDSRAEVLRTLGRFASDKELNFDWADAAMVSVEVRKEGAK